MQKKGFIATSLIYSFFLVFLILMTTTLSRSVHNRILLSAVKEDIREELNGQAGFIVDTVENKTYALRETIHYANEDWQVLQNKAGSIVVMLKRSLLQSEMINVLGSFRDAEEYYGTCNASTCQVRACRSAYSGREYCYLYSPNPNLFLAPSWKPTEAEIENVTKGKTIVSDVVNLWFQMHQGLARAMSNDRLISMTFSDGFKNNTGYVRLPTSSEKTIITDGDRPYHLVNSPTDGKTVRISSGDVPSNTPAFVRPVIEIKKGE